MRPGEFYWSMKQFEGCWWLTFIVYCFWHGHFFTGMIFIFLFFVDGAAAHSRLEDFRKSGGDHVDP